MCVIVGFLAEGAGILNIAGSVFLIVRTFLVCLVGYLAEGAGILNIAGSVFLIVRTFIRVSATPGFFRPGSFERESLAPERHFVSYKTP